MKIRIAIASDASTIAELSSQLGYPTQPDQATAYLTDLANRSDHVVFVSESTDGLITGWIHVCCGYLLATGPFVEIGGLVVGEGQRSHGIGAALVDTACQWAAERSYQSIWVHSNVIRERAHNFYRMRGFTLWKTQSLFVYDLHP